MGSKIPACSLCLSFSKEECLSLALIPFRESQRCVLTCKDLQVDPAEKWQLDGVRKAWRNSQGPECPHPNKCGVCVCERVCTRARVFACIYVLVSAYVCTEEDTQTSDIRKGGKQ